MLTITLDDRSLIEVLRQINGKTDDLSAPLRDIGESVQEVTIQRFETSRGPDGRAWEPNSRMTILQYLALYKSSYGKTGKMTKAGAQRASAKSPLIGETRSLMSTIHYQLEGRRSVLIGSPMVYASVQQFGAGQGAFGADRRNHPLPWGDIPPRPFLGVSDEDKRNILDILEHYYSTLGG